MAEKRGRKRKNGLYFGPEQEKAVVDFLTEEDYIIRNKIYNVYILFRNKNKLVYLL